MGVDGSFPRCASSFSGGKEIPSNTEDQLHVSINGLPFDKNIQNIHPEADVNNAVSSRFPLLVNMRL